MNGENHKDVEETPHLFILSFAICAEQFSVGLSHSAKCAELLRISQISKRPSLAHDKSVQVAGNPRMLDYEGTV